MPRILVAHAGCAILARGDDYAVVIAGGGRVAEADNEVSENVILVLNSNPGFTCTQQ